MIFQEGPVRNPQNKSGNNRKQFPLCLILAPTRELASQIYDEARKVFYKLKQTQFPIMRKFEGSLIESGKTND